TEVFDRLAQAYETDQGTYQLILEGHLKDIYADAFKHIPDLAHASQEQLIDAFKVYDLPKQHRRMVALFKGLCRQAGLTVGETEMPETDLVNEQDSEIDTITLQETSTPDTL